MPTNHKRERETDRQTETERASADIALFEKYSLFFNIQVPILYRCWLRQPSSLHLSQVDITVRFTHVLHTIAGSDLRNGTPSRNY